MPTSWGLRLPGLAIIEDAKALRRLALAEDAGRAGPQDLQGRRKAKARWVLPDGRVTVAGRKIGGMVYLGPDRHQGPWLTGGSPFIDPDLPVAKTAGNSSGENLAYRPSYHSLRPQERAGYLDWLAGGRRDGSCGPGYVFLFFYGLERRFFVDSPSRREKQKIVAEAERLLDIYGEHVPLRGCLTRFLEIARIKLTPICDIQPQFDLSCRELPLSLRVAIGHKAKTGRSLNADWILSWYVAGLGHTFRKPARRAFPEFRALFKLLFDERFPKGIKIRSPKRLPRIHHAYAPASGAFILEPDKRLDELPDILFTLRPLDAVSGIVEEATGELARYSRFLGRNPERRNTIKAHALLPKRLWPMFPCAEMEALSAWATEILEKGGFFPVEQIMERFEGAAPEKISKRQLTGAADTLGRISVGMAPDPRFAPRGPKPGEPVVLFQLPEGMAGPEEVGQTYRDVFLSIALGGVVAHADGAVTKRERDVLAGRISAAAVSETERARLFADLRWMLKVPPDLTLLRRRLKDIPENARHELVRVALAVAAADGMVAPEEIKAIGKLYKAMDIETESVYSDLHALIAGDGPVTVRHAEKGKQGFAVPSPPACGSKVALDSGRVASIMTNTAHASSILSDIFQDNEPEEASGEMPEDDGERFSGLDPKHSAFLDELLTREHWSEAEFAALASRFRLMHEGALETMNEWSSERFDDMLIDAYQDYAINQEIKARLEC